MQDHLGVLGIVDAALAVADLVLRVIGLEGVVLLYWSIRTSCDSLFTAGYFLPNPRLWMYFCDSVIQ
ncbi:MAG TPA: hypothetical protein VIR59_13160 [Gaiellaceae bacterium]